MGITILIPWRCVTKLPPNLHAHDLAQIAAYAPLPNTYHLRIITFPESPFVRRMQQYYPGADYAPLGSPSYVHSFWD